MNSIRKITGQLINQAALSILALYTLTTVHHIYGGLVDQDFKRLYVPIIALIPLLITQGALYQYKRTRSGVALAAFSIVAVLWWVMVDGLLHGGYAHAYKDVLYLAGVSAEAANRFYYPLNPSEHYPPDNFFFEMTGVLELVVAYFVALFTVRLIRDRQKGESKGVLPEQAVHEGAH